MKEIFLKAKKNVSKKFVCGSGEMINNRSISNAQKNSEKNIIKENRVSYQ